jgi:hypothetical protein
MAGNAVAEVVGEQFVDHILVANLLGNVSNIVKSGVGRFAER